MGRLSASLPLHELDPARGIAGLNTSPKRLMSSITDQDPAYARKVATFGLPARVDVQNVADAHFNLSVLPKGTSERFMLRAGIDYCEDGLAGLRAKGGKGLGEEGEMVYRIEFHSADWSKAESL